MPDLRGAATAQPVDTWRQRGWRVEDLDGDHLDVLARPDVVAAVVVQALQA